MKKIITGYQYGDENQFIGQYEFENNLDQEKIHLPPRTTLVAPPEIPQYKRAIWDGKKWNIEDDLRALTEKERIEEIERMMEEQRQSELVAQLESQNTSPQLSES